LKTRNRVTKLLVLLIILLACPPPTLAFSERDVAQYQSLLKDRAINEKIALWAEKFVGTPYDRDPLGEYVTKKTVVTDERVDCMYLVFRSVELAVSSSPDGAIEAALDKRFRTKGVLKNGRVENYGERFEYGEDMIDSGKWGREITSELGRTRYVKGSRGKIRVAFLPPRELKKGISRLKNGDLLFFIKDPRKRISGEIVGHMGIVKVEAQTGKASGKRVYLIHAGGTKKRGGVVKKVLLTDYIKTMPYMGVRITRF
jgi:cell wall-associated NlpC family hydrolase